MGYKKLEHDKVIHYQLKTPLSVEYMAVTQISCLPPVSRGFFTTILKFVTGQLSVLCL